MPRKSTYTKKDIVRAAVMFVEKHGIKALSARKIAGQLGCSTAPVYSSFVSMRVLETEVIRIIRDMLIAYTEKPYTDHADLNMGSGIVLFARDEPLLFRSLFLEGKRFKMVTDEIFEACDRRLKKLPMYGHMPDKERRTLLRQLAIFSHGLATYACVGLLEDDSNEYIIYTIWNMGRAFISAALMDISSKKDHYKIQGCAMKETADMVTKEKKKSIKSKRRHK